MDISNLYDLYLSAEGVSTDTRQIKPGMLYFALKGPNFNGNKFAQQALDQGAMACIIDDASYAGQGRVLVKNSLESLQALAQFHRRQLDYPVVGLTGSNGKTTTKELIVAALSPRFKVGYTQGNLNNHIGVPLSLLNLPPDSEIAVIEMGANAQKEIAFLASLAQPDIGLITNFGKAHLEGFGGIEGVIKGKSELYAHLRERNKIAWVNVEDPLQIEGSANLARRSFGNKPEADFYIRPGGIYNSEGMLAILLGALEIRSQLTGDYNFSNLAAAASLALHFGLEPTAIKSGLEAYQPTNHRSQLEKGQHNWLIKDFYNANPSSMEAALRHFARLERRQKWVILGDMFELGESSAEEHRQVLALAQSQGYERIISIGEAFGGVHSGSDHYPSTEAALAALKEEAPRGKTILLKGSRGMQLEKLLPAL